MMRFTWLALLTALGTGAFAQQTAVYTYNLRRFPTATELYRQHKCGAALEL